MSWKHWNKVLHSISALVSGHDFQEEHKTTILSIQKTMELPLLIVTVLDTFTNCSEISNYQQALNQKLANK